MNKPHDVEHKVDQFLRANRPLAPRAPLDELEQIHNAITKNTEPRWWHFAIPSLVAASLALMLIVPASQQDVKTPYGNNLDTFLAETVGSFYGTDEQDEANLTIGGDWLDLTDD